jgi:transposase
LVLPTDISGSEIHHLPIVTGFARRIRLVETINYLVPSETDVAPGILVLLMVLDALAGRHPLYRVGAFFQNKDVELLAGEDVDLDYLSDDNFGRLLDRLYEANTTRVFSHLAMNALEAFEINSPHIHFDTTSIRVYGSYDPAEDAEDSPPFQITHGFSKDHRPDLKQFLVSLLCVGGNVPFFGKMEDGNASDKTLNNAVLSTISHKLAAVGLAPEASIYIADSALVTEPNLAAIGDSTRFITRLPATFKDHERVVHEAVAAQSWTDYGALAKTPASPKRPAARYRGYESTVTLYGKTYRAIVVHSSAHDRRRQKRLQRRLAEESKACAKRLQDIAKTSYFCRDDAQAAADALQKESRRYHDLDLIVERRPRYRRGRPKADGTQTVAQMRYGVTGTLRERTHAVDQAKEEAGCFVLITNVPPEGFPDAPTPYDGKTLLEAYKDQQGVERNFSFLKDPVLVNALFLKKPERIEALGLILLIALLLWRLMELSMRRHVTATQSKLSGWDNKPTDRPTTFMMTTKFEGVLVLKTGVQRTLMRPLTLVQRGYLAALGLPPSVFTQPPTARGSP